MYRSAELARGLYRCVTEIEPKRACSTLRT
jgi:hypothetical protein